MTIEVDIFGLLKFLGAAIAAVVFIFLIHYVYRAVAIFFRSREYRLDKEGIKKQWQSIEDLLKKPGEMNYKLAVLEADKLLDYVLKSMTMPGKDLAERLRFASFKFTKLKRVWWAHGVRNQLVHETSFHLGYGLAKKAVKEFKRALEEIGAL
jgi:hypothetical protein